MADQGGRSALEVVMTVLHAGGKFGGDGYKVSGGLHGVGISVVNALSESLVAEVRRDGGLFVQRFATGEPQGPVERAGQAADTGTIVTFLPDPDIFEEPDFDFETLAQRLRETAFLTRGLVVRLVDRRGEGREVEYHYEGGIRDFVSHLNETRDAAPPRRGLPRGGRRRGRPRGRPPVDRGATARPSTRSRTTSTRTRAAPTSPGSAPPSPAPSTTTRAPRACSRRRTTTSRARTRARASRRSSR